MGSNLYNYVNNFSAYGNNSALPKCKSCGHEFPRGPDYPRFAHSDSAAERDAAFVAYRRAFRDWERKIGEHLTSAGHGFGLCNRCGDVLRKTALSAHKRSKLCEQQMRCQSLEQRGYDPCPNYKHLREALRVLQRMVNDTIDFDDLEARRLVEDAKTATIRELQDTGCILLAYTEYSPENSTKPGWHAKPWSDPGTVLAMGHCFHEYENLPYNTERERREAVLLKCYFDFCKFLQSSEDEQFAALGIWELAKGSE